MTQMVKINLDWDEDYPSPYLKTEDNKYFEPDRCVEIPQEKLDWILKTFDEEEKVREYLKTIKKP